MEYRLLSTACEYRKDRISADEVDENTYISSVNLELTIIYHNLSQMVAMPSGYYFVLFALA